MIKINLAQRRQSELDRGGKGFKGFQSLFKNIGVEELEGLPIKKLAMSIITGMVAGYILDGYKEDELLKLQKSATKYSEESKKLQTEINKFKDFDGIKKTLELDESTLRTKIETIQKLIENREDPIRMLNLISTSIPPDVWLSIYKVEKSNVTIVGTTLDMGQISDFMKNLRDSTRFNDVELKDSQQQKELVEGKATSIFELRAVWR